MVLRNASHIKSEVLYPCTNESIPAVIAGLELKREDVVVSIAGSGDIPFAIAPYVSKVYAVDSEKCQLEFMQEQVEFLRNKDFKGFSRSEFMKRNAFERKYQRMDGRDAGMNHMDARRNYFEQRFSEVRDSLPKVEILDADIFEFMGSLDRGSVDKAYISNVLERVADSYVDVGCIARAVKIGGIVYDNSRESWEPVEIDSTRDLRIKNRKTKEVGDIQSSMDNELYHWTPSVYERVARVAQ